MKRCLVTGWILLPFLTVSMRQTGGYPVQADAQVTPQTVAPNDVADVGHHPNKMQVARAYVLGTTRNGVATTTATSGITRS